MANKYYSSKAWKQLSQLVLKRDGYKCQRCGSSENLVVHHIQPRSDGGPDFENNLKTVCKSCHVKEHIDLSREKYPPIGKYAPTREELLAMGLDL
jgi:5-methylcytosine-specific restriction endonuclease McrA